MKKIPILLVLLAAFFICGQVSAQKNVPLRFNKDGKLRIAQFTDLHWDHKSPEYKRTLATMQAVLEAEKPDIAILTGDVVTAAPAPEAWNTIATFFEQARVPFAVTMGNHDAEASISKDEIYNILAQYTYFVGEKGPEDIFGTGNYILPVYDSKGQNKVSALLYCIDSNDYPSKTKFGHYDWIHYDQIQWYREQSDYYTRQNNGIPLPALAFFHIPLLEYYNIVGRNTTVGIKKEGIASPQINSGMFASMVEKEDVIGMFVGHDHDNDYIGIDQGIAMAFGRTTGVQAYGELERGGRIIELYEDKFKFDTWIRTPSGTEFAYYFPSGLSSVDEENLDYLPAKAVNPTRQGVAYTYYEGKFKQTADIARGTKKDEGVMKNFSITSAPLEDGFGYEFRTLIKIPDTGVYRFYLFSDDGSRMYIDDTLVVDNDGGHSSKRVDGKAALEAGYHEIRLLYFEDYMGQVLEAGYSSRDIRESTFPDHILYLPE